MKKVDKDYCINSFLQFRYVYDNNKIFKKGLFPNYYSMSKPEYFIKNVDDIDFAIKDYIKKNVDEKTALMLSGGIDSAILASYFSGGGYNDFYIKMCC